MKKRVSRKGLRTRKSKTERSVAGAGKINQEERREETTMMMIDLVLTIRSFFNSEVN